jgi:hypothetical protein
MFPAGGQTTTVDIGTQTVTGMTVAPATQNVAAGDDVELTVSLTGSLNPDVPYMTVAPSAATFVTTVARTEGEGDAATTVAVNSPRTRVDEYGILHVAKSLEVGDVITVVATSTYINPSGETTEYTATGTYTVA